MFKRAAALLLFLSQSKLSAVLQGLNFLIKGAFRRLQNFRCIIAVADGIQMTLMFANLS